MRFLRVLKRHRLPQKIRSIKSLPVSLQAGINFREADSAEFIRGGSRLPLFFPPLRIFGSFPLIVFKIFFYSLAVSFNCSPFDAVDTCKLTHSAAGVARLSFSPFSFVLRGIVASPLIASLPLVNSLLGNQPGLSKYQRVAFNLGSNNK